MKNSIHGRKKEGLDFVLSMVIGLSVFILFLGTELLCGCFNSEMLKTVILSTGYGSKIETEFIEKQAEILDSYGIPKSMVQQLWEEDEPYMILQRFLDSKGKMEIDADKQEEIAGYFQAQKIPETDATKQSMESLKKELESVAKRYLAPRFITNYFSYTERAGRIVIGAMLAAFIFGGCSLIFLYHRHRSRRHRLRFLAGGLWMSAVWNLAAAALLHKLPLEQIKTGSVAYGELMTALAEYAKMPFAVGSIALMLLTFVITAVVIFWRR